MGRKYTINEAEYPSVTTILDVLDKSQALIPWALNCFESKILETNGLSKTDNGVIEISTDDISKAKKEYKDVSQTALDIGTQIHDLIEQYLKTGKDPFKELKDEVTNGFLAFLEWEKDNIESWIESEAVTVNETWGYAGTLDAIAKMKDGRVMVIDFKSSKGFYSGYDMQIASYRYARETMNGEYKIALPYPPFKTYKKVYLPMKIDGMGVLRLDKVTGLPEWKDYSKVYERKLETFKTLTKFYYLNADRRLKGNMLAKQLKDKFKK